MYFRKKNYLVQKVKVSKQRRQGTHEAAATSMIIVTPLKNILLPKILGSRGVWILPSVRDRNNPNCYRFGLQEPYNPGCGRPRALARLGNQGVVKQREGQQQNQDNILANCPDKETDIRDLQD